MTSAHNIAFLNSQTAVALIKCEGMKARNREAEMSNEYPTYGEDDFERLILDTGIGHNDALKILHGV